MSVAEIYSLEKIKETRVQKAAAGLLVAYFVLEKKVPIHEKGELRVTPAPGSIITKALNNNYEDLKLLMTNLNYSIEYSGDEVVMRYISPWLTLELTDELLNKLIDLGEDETGRVTHKLSDLLSFENIAD